MVIAIEGIYKDGVIKPLEEVKIEDNSKVIITILDEKKMKGSLMDLAGIWKDDKDTYKLFKKVYQERSKFKLRGY